MVAIKDPLKIRNKIKKLIIECIYHFSGIFLVIEKKMPFSNDQNIYLQLLHG